MARRYKRKSVRAVRGKKALRARRAARGGGLKVATYREAMS